MEPIVIFDRKIHEAGEQKKQLPISHGEKKEEVLNEYQYYLLDELV